MDNKIKDLIVAFFLSMTYIILGALNVYSMTFLAFIPILVLPIVIYGIKKSDKNIDFILYSTIILCIALGGNSLEAIIFTFTILLPSYIIIAGYHKNISLPHHFIYLTLAIWVGTFICFNFLTLVGIDYIQIYFNFLEQYLEQYKDTALNITFETIEFMKSIYFAMFFLVSMWVSTICLCIIKFTFKIRKWNFPKFNQLLDFKLSQISILVFLLILMLLQTNKNSVTEVVGVNATIIFVSLYQLIGFFSILSVARKSKKLKDAKVITAPKYLLIIIIIVVIIFTPYTLVSIGIIDTIINYRKVKFVV
ncbi:hypothetical protein AN639_11005 [Candidatus Epulonipiscium fishelsonii]|uniref:Uncharacterized protein n=1 Tax=Candidatus Epulonipiscium fishelsonii TaxID=77094 RepID=A0ACC8XCQ3_9FIRM|nr:hypothetical protein AN396_05830 [Epulopiscium sp. SCG-B11WGA-EpuloA1]ONI43201.1 hypothetical protein AN639_11005 [Epulopiscium sp. SCG-B05WGA-EpuloA1]